MKFTYIGHSAFILESDDKTVLIDPFVTGNPVATVNVDDLSADAILLTHAHNDHVGDTVAIAKRTGAVVIGMFELATWIGTQGVENVSPGNHGGTIAFPGGTVKFVPAWHTSSYESDEGVVAPGVPAGLVVRFGGKTTYFAGDTGLFLDMQLIAEEGLDVAVLPIGDRFTMGPRDAARAAGILGAETVIPCHYNTFPAIGQDGNGFKDLVESQTASRVLPLLPASQWSCSVTDRDAFNAEMRRTAYQRKVVSRLPAKDVLDLAIAFFTERGYRAARTGRPHQVFVMGKAEGILPRVTGEIAARADVGKPGTTLVTLDAAGERLGPAMKDFYAELRARRPAPSPPPFGQNASNG